VSTSVRPARVLAVEDSATQAAALAILLEDAGYEVVIARSGERALELVQRERFDVVLSDVLMPGVSGFEVCRRIKNELGHPELPVVLLTSLTDPLDIVRGLECGADNYVTKPYEPTRLLARLATVLRENVDRARHGARGLPVQVSFQGVTFSIGADKEHIVELLVSSYEDLVRTSEAVRDAERRARFLADAGEQLSSSLDEDKILRTLAQVSVPALADLAVVDAFDAAGAARRAGVQHTDPACAARVAALAPSLDPRTLTAHEATLVDPLDGRPPNAADAALLRELGAGSAFRSSPAAAPSACSCWRTPAGASPRTTSPSPPTWRGGRRSRSITHVCITPPSRPPGRATTCWRSCRTTCGTRCTPSA
jgi:DNA-binding response OmpR family regulator